MSGKWTVLFCKERNGRTENLPIQIEQTPNGETLPSKAVKTKKKPQTEGNKR
jgi:hypothetical protein